MDGVLAVQARIAAIEALVAPRRGAPAPGATSAGGSFERTLAAAMASHPGGGAAVVAAPSAPSVTATVRGVGGYGRLEPPAELLQYGNGKVPATALTALRSADGHSLHAPAAAQWDRLVDAAAADGVDIGITDSYRPLAVQEDVARRKGLYKNGGLAAVPGTSPHGWGLSVDVDVDAAGQQWLRSNAHRFGFVEDTPREPWHWTFRPDPVA